jgi:signal transduction histidine kinase
MTNGSEDPTLTAERQIEILQEQLVQAQKLTALGELVSTTTHEFNNVLMTILNYAKIGLRHQDNATRTKAFERILSAAERANKITNAVLGVARNRSDRFTATNLVELLNETLVLLEREFSKYRIRVERHIAEVPKVMANGNQIQQVLLNLLINARQAMPDGGSVTLRLEHDAEAQMVSLSVRDTGSGIPAEKLPHIFDRFFTTKSGPDATGRGGTGLGLASCRSIIEAHRGRIRVESAVGKGTCFTIKLPLQESAPPPLATGLQPTSQWSGSRAQ